MKEAEKIYSKHGLEAYKKIGIEGEWMDAPEWCINAMEEYARSRLTYLLEEIEKRENNLDILEDKLPATKHSCDIARDAFSDIKALIQKQIED